MHKAYLKILKSACKFPTDQLSEFFLPRKLPPSLKKKAQNKTVQLLQLFVISRRIFNFNFMTYPLSHITLFQPWLPVMCVCVGKLILMVLGRNYLDIKGKQCKHSPHSYTAPSSVSWLKSNINR